MTSASQGSLERQLLWNVGRIRPEGAERLDRWLQNGVGERKGEVDQKGGVSDEQPVKFAPWYLKKNDSGRCSRLQEGKIDLWLAYNPTALSLAFPVDCTVKHLSSYSLKLKRKMLNCSSF